MFPTAGHFDQPSTTLQLVDAGAVVLHRYEYLVNGVAWRNVEALHVADGQVHDVEVCFGGATRPAESL